MTVRYVTYYVAPQQQKGGLKSIFPLQEEAETEIIGLEKPDPVIEYLNKQDPKGEIIASFTETPESRKTAKWPELQKALQMGSEKGATLLIAELGTLTNNEPFTQLLLKSNAPFYCIDQPFVNRTILEALSKHAEVQRKLHGKLIREGLKMTSAKSGNPNAAEVISKVNKPKIDTAIVFACLLLPIILDYRRKGYSQRQMVKTLNEEGFTAPEGGKWVLSQLQKVLERVRLNEISIELREVMEELSAQMLNESQMAEALNTKGIPSLKQPAWDEAQVKKLNDRIYQLKDIVLINRFVLDLLPLLHEYKRHNLSLADILNDCQTIGIPIRHNYPLEVALSKGELSRNHLKHHLEKLKANLAECPEGHGFLDICFESAAKHIPAYLKIVKTHIDQLAKVLELEAHNHRNLESVGLAEPVIQLMQLFRELTEEDLQLIEMLAEKARHWTHAEVPETAEPLAIAV
jgi:hypothetical protein